MQQLYRYIKVYYYILYQNKKIASNRDETSVLTNMGIILSKRQTKGYKSCSIKSVHIRTADATLVYYRTADVTVVQYRTAYVILVY